MGVGAGGQPQLGLPSPHAPAEAATNTAQTQGTATRIRRFIMWSRCHLRITDHEYGSRLPIYLALTSAITMGGMCIIVISGSLFPSLAMSSASWNDRAVSYPRSFGT